VFFCYDSVLDWATRYYGNANINAVSHYMFRLFRQPSLHTIDGYFPRLFYVTAAFSDSDDRHLRDDLKPAEMFRKNRPVRSIIRYVDVRELRFCATEKCYTNGRFPPERKYGETVLRRSRSRDVYKTRPLVTEIRRHV